MPRGPHTRATCVNYSHRAHVEHRTRRVARGSLTVSETEAHGRTIRTVRLNDEQLSKLLDMLDDAPSAPPTSGRSARYRYRTKGLVVKMQQPGFSIPVAYQTYGHDVSATGLSFLHGGYVHAGTRCVTQLITTYGTWNDVKGTVVRCKYVQGNIHVVGVEFDTPVNPAVYCADAVQSRVLLVEDSLPMAKLAMFHLQSLNAEVDHVTDGKPAVEAALSHAYDLTLMDIELPAMNGLDAVKKLRESGYAGTIVAMTGLTQPGDKERCLAGGCDGYLPKPFVKGDFARILESLHQEPLFSTMHDDPSMEDMIGSFVGTLPEHMRAIERARAAADVDQLKATMRVLKSEGTAYGFEVITEAAGTVETALLNGSSLADVRAALDKLSNLCGQARGPVRLVPANANNTSEPATSALAAQ